MIRGNFILCPVRKQIQSSLTHVDNLAYAIELYLAKTDSVSLQIFNISDDKPYFLRELMQQITSAIEKRQLTCLPFSRTILDIFLYINSKTHLFKNISQPVLDSFNINSILDITKIRKEQNYLPARNIQNSYKEIAEWVGTFGSSREYLKMLPEATWRGHL